MKYEAFQIIVAVTAVVVSAAAFVVTYLRVKRERAERERRLIQHQLNEERKRVQRTGRHEERPEERQHAHA